MGISVGKNRFVRNKYLEYRQRYLEARDFSKKLNDTDLQNQKGSDPASQENKISKVDDIVGGQNDPIKKMLFDYQKPQQVSQENTKSSQENPRKSIASQKVSAPPASAPTEVIQDPGLMPSTLSATNSSRMQRALEPYKAHIRAAAVRYNLPEELIAGVIWQESRGNPRAVSHCGAMGLMQLMPETAKNLGVSNAFHPGQNIDGGAKYLRQMLDMFGRVDHAVAAYNAGPGNVKKHAGIPPFRETQDYVPRVLGGANTFKVAGGFQDERQATAIRV